MSFSTHLLMMSWLLHYCCSLHGFRACAQVCLILFIASTVAALPYPTITNKVSPFPQDVCPRAHRCVISRNLP